MPPDATEASLKDLIVKMRLRLDDAAALAKEAEACVDAGNPAQALTIVIDAALPIYEATTFLNAVSLIDRAEHMSR
jgi:hypothetical protein